MEISSYSSNYASSMLKQDVSISMLKKSLDTQSMAVEKIISSSAINLGANLNTYA